MKQHLDTFERGVIKGSFPSGLNWLLSLLFLIAVFAFGGIVIFDQREFLGEFLEKQRVNVLVPGTLGLFLVIRGGMGAYRKIQAASYLFIEFPRMRKKLPEYAPYDKVAYVCTAYHKEEIEIWNTLSSIYLASYRYGAQQVYLMVGMSEHERGEDEFRIAEAVREFMISAAGSEDEKSYYKDNVILVAFSQDGTGKRMAMSEAIDFVLDSGNVDLWVTKDGDTCCEPDSLKKVAPFFQFYDKLGGATVANQADVEGGILYNTYCHTRFLLRDAKDLPMAATVLTGRESYIRGNILTKETAKTLLHHYVTFQGENILALTGDDKTMVKLVWSQGYETLYIPDVVATAMEKPLDLDEDAVKTKIATAFGVEQEFQEVRSFGIQEPRYSGNMLLHNMPLRDSVHHSGNVNARIKLWDQMFFHWSALVGITSGMLASLYYGNFVLFVIWFEGSLFLRLLVTYTDAMVLAISTRSKLAWHPLMPLMNFSNIAQAVIKTRRIYNLAKQLWSRGGGKSEKKSNNIWPIMVFSIIVVWASIAILT